MGVSQGSVLGPIMWTIKYNWGTNYTSIYKYTKKYIWRGTGIISKGAFGGDIQTESEWIKKTELSTV